MPCYTIPVVTTTGVRDSIKWGNSPEDALSILKKLHGTKSGMGILEYGTPTLVHPQPFSDESRALAAARNVGQPVVAVAPAVPVKAPAVAPSSVTQDGQADLFAFDVPKAKAA